MSIIHRRRPAMNTGGYFVVASIIRKMEPPALRQQMADYFATEFNKRSPSFDPYEWEKATGGKVAPNSAKMSSNQ